MSSERRDDPTLAAVFDFVSSYWEEHEAGRGHELSWWIRRYPGYEEEIAREFLALQEPAADASAQAQRIGPYEVVRELGSGGQGAVYLAHDTRIERVVALKVLSGFFGGIAEERRARLRREAEVIARLDHPGICAIHDAEIDTDPPWLAMRHVEGATLASVLAAAKDPARDPGGLPVLTTHWPAREVVDIHALLAFFEKAARALHAAHEAGVIHRDIKPGNIMVSTAGEPVILDFGLAREEREEDAAALTLEGEMLGTPAYMSPEQLRNGATLDRRTDVYSLGASLYEALTLQRVFQRNSRSELFRAIEQEEPRDPREHNPALPSEVSAVLSVALAKDPAGRYASALEFAEDLRRIRVYEPIRARPPGMTLRLLRWTQRNPWLAAALLILMLALGFSLWTLSAERAALRVALGRHLGGRAQALVGEDPSAAVALGVQACELAPNYLTRAALLNALDACALERELRTPQARTSEDFALDASGRWLAVALSGFEDGSRRLVIHDLLSGATRGVEGQWINSLQKLLSVPGKDLLLAARQDGAVLTLDPATGSVRATVELGEGIRDWSVSADGERLLTRSREGKLELHSIPELSTVSVLRESGCEHASFDETGEQVIAISKGADKLAAWNARSGALQVEHDCPAAWVRRITVARGIAWIATQESELARIELDSGRIERIPLPNSNLKIEELRISPDARQLLVLLSREERGSAFLLDTTNLARTELLPEDSRFALRGAFRADSGRVALACSDTSVRIFDCAGGALLRQFRGRFRAQDLLYSPDGTRLHTRNVGGVVMCWYAGTRPDLLRFQAPAAITAVHWNAAGDCWEARTADGMRHEFDLRSDMPQRSQARALAAAPKNTWMLPGGALHERTERKLVFEPDAGSGGFEIDLSKPVPSSPREVSVAPDGSEFTLVTNSLRVLRVRLPDGAILEELRAFVARSASYSPDSKRLLLLGEHGGGAFRLLELRGAEKSRILPTEIFHAADLCLGGFSPDGDVFVTASRDGVVFVRDTRGGLPRTQFQAAGTPTALGFQGSRVLLGTQEGTIHGFPIDPLPLLEGRIPRPLEEWEIGNERRLALPLRYDP